MKSIYFVTPTLLSEIDLTTIGGSEKAGDETKIGKFCSGLKYALAIFQSRGVETVINVHTSRYDGPNDDSRKIVFTYSFGSHTVRDENTEKEKELLKITKEMEAESFHSAMVCDEYQGEEGDFDDFYTGIALAFGENWETWQALREIFSNMLDEGGYHTEEQPIISYGTIIKLSFPEDHEMNTIWADRSKYFSEVDPEYVVTDDISIGVNEDPEQELRIYKQGILVYSDKNKKTPFTFHIKFGDLDERRILHDPYSVSKRITAGILGSENKEFLDWILRANLKCSYLAEGNNYDVGDSLLEVVNSIDQDEFMPLSQVFEPVRSNDKYKGIGRVTSSVNYLHSAINRTTEVLEPISVITERVAERPMTPEECYELTKEEKFIQDFQRMYSIDLPVPIAFTFLKGANSVFDRANNLILISEDFSFDEDRDVCKFIFDIVASKTGRYDSVTDQLLMYIKKLTYNGA